VALIGRLDIEGVQSIGLRFSAQTAGRKKNSIVDLSGVEFLASLGIGTLVETAKALQMRGARMVLMNPPPLIAETLKTSKIDKIIPIVKDTDEALELFASE
jgi:anti-anti-sigma factor